MHIYTRTGLWYKAFNRNHLTYRIPYHPLPAWHGWISGLEPPSRAKCYFLQAMCFKSWPEMEIKLEKVQELSSTMVAWDQQLFFWAKEVRYDVRCSQINSCFSSGGCTKPQLEFKVAATWHDSCASHQSKKQNQTHCTMQTFQTQHVCGPWI